jgi:phosphatidylglycerophosphate synthase
MTEMSDRMADIAIFLGLTFSPLVDKVLGLLAIICILMVSFVGILGKAVGTERVRAGVLGKTERMIFLMVACLLFSIAPQFDFRGYTVFGILLLLFMPLASLTLMQRLERILSVLAGRSG